MTNDPQGGPEETGTAPAPEGQPAPTGPEPPKSWLAKWWWLILLAVVVLGVLIGIAFWSGGGESDEAAAVTVPDVVGMSQADAEAALTEVGLVAGEITEEPSADMEPGTVLSQDPEAGAEVEEGAMVDLTVAVEVDPEMVVVPDIVGMDLADAEAALEAVGLVVGDVQEQESPDVPPGTVVSQDPEAESEVDMGSAVDLVVTASEPGGVVPNVVGMTEADAVGSIGAAGFVARVYLMHSEDVQAGIVIEQRPASGTELERGEMVGIAVSQGPTPPPETTTVIVPDLAGMTADEASAELDGAGLVAAVFDVYHDTIPEGGVVGQFPVAGTEVLKGSSVAVLASKGPATEPGPERVEVPDTVGMTAADAQATIEGAGLGVIPLMLPYDQADLDTVFFQLPPAGTMMNAGSYMVVFVAAESTGSAPPMVQPYAAK